MFRSAEFLKIVNYLMGAHGILSCSEDASVGIGVLKKRYGVSKEGANQNQGGRIGKRTEERGRTYRPLATAPIGTS